MGSLPTTSMARTFISAFLVVTAMIALGVTQKFPTPRLADDQTLSWFAATGPSDNCTNVPTEIIPGALDDSICKGVRFVCHSRSDSLCLCKHCPNCGQGI